MEVLNSFCDNNAIIKKNNIKNIINNSKIRYILIILLIPFLMIMDVDDVFAKKKSKKKRSRAKKTRVYNPAKTKANAIATLQTSDKLSKLANIDTTATHPESQAYAIDSGAYKPLDTIQASDIEILKTYLTDEIDTNVIGEMGENIDELTAEDDIKVNLDDFKSIWLLAIGATNKSITDYGVEKELLMGIIMEWLGTPYRFGGESKNAIDCSAWIRAIFFQANSIYLPRTARDQILVGNKINRNNLEFGDLVFFHTYSKKFASHVGIYLGDNLFAHASSIAGVTVSSLNSTFYATRYIGGRRLSSKDVLAYKKIATTEKLNFD